MGKRCHIEDSDDDRDGKQQVGCLEREAAERDELVPEQQDEVAGQQEPHDLDQGEDRRRMLRISDPTEGRDHRQRDERQRQHRLSPSPLAIPAIRDRHAESHKTGRRQVLQQRRRLGQDSPCPPLRPSSIQVGI